MSGAGDINGDGFDDILVEAYEARTGHRGGAYIVFGKSAPFPANIDLSTIDGTNGFVISGPEEGYDSGIGRDVSAAGDVNGDGVSDIVIGVDDRSDSHGSSFVVFGSSSGSRPISR